MEDDNTEYIDGNADDFTIFLFSSPPKDKNSIKLELGPTNGIHIGLHIFQELLMIFTSGLKYLFSKDDIMDVTLLEDKDIELMNQYFESFGHTILIEKFTISDYLSNMKLPNYFRNHDLIEEYTQLDGFYYETYLKDHIYRISFDFLREG